MSIWFIFLLTILFKTIGGVVLYDASNFDHLYIRNNVNPAWASSSIANSTSVVKVADNFFVPKGENWIIDSVFVRGVFLSSGNSLTRWWNIEFFSNQVSGSDMFPSEPKLTSFTAPHTTGVSGYSQGRPNLPVPNFIAEGNRTYWVSVFPSIDTGIIGSNMWLWGRYNTSHIPVSAAGRAAHYQTTNYLSGPLNTWRSLESIYGYDDEADLSFSISGTRVDVGPPTCHNINITPTIANFTNQTEIIIQFYLDVTDNLSGFKNATIVLQQPHPSNIKYDIIMTASNRIGISSIYLSNLTLQKSTAPNGEWNVVSIKLYDQNDNMDYIIDNRLSNLGNISFNVVGSQSLGNITSTTGTSGTTVTTGTAGTSGTTGLPYNPIQACPSGYINVYPSCSYAAGNCSFHVPTSNATINPPFILPSSIIQLDSIRLTVLQRITRDRKLVGINLNSSNPECNYPGLNWSKSVNQFTCHDEYTFFIPTSTALSSCGFVKNESNPDYTFYDGIATATWEDEISLDPVRGLNITRSSTGVLRFRLGFPKRVAISTSNVIFGSANVISAVINQVYDPYTGLLEIKLLTSTQSPYRLNNPVIVQSPFGVIVTTSLFSNCPSHTQYCDQIFSIVMSRNGTCTYDGTYRFNANVTCLNCSSNPDVTSIQFSIQSGDVCGRVDDITTVIPFIQSYGNFNNGTFQNVRTSFEMNDRVFLQLSVSSSGPRIQSSRIASVTVSNANGQPVLIISQDAPLVNGSYALLISSTATQRNHVISYVYQESWFGSVLTTPVTSTVSVVIDLTYSNGNKRSVVIRSSPDSYGNQLSTSTSLSVIGDHRDTISSSSRLFLSGMLLIVLSFISCFM